MQRRHSLTSISGKGSPIESDKKQKTPWKMMRSFMGSSNKSEPATAVKKKSSISTTVAPPKKQSLIEIAREEDPYLGIWMGPQEKLDMPETDKNPRSRSFEVPSAKVSHFCFEKKPK